MLNLYKFHTNPDELEQQIVIHQSLDDVYQLLKDIFTIYYVGKDFKLTWKHDVVSNAEQYVEVAMELKGKYSHGMIRIYYENSTAQVKTSIQGTMISHAVAYDDSKLDVETILNAIEELTAALRKNNA